MKEHRSWSSGPSAFERQLLEAARSDTVPAHLKARMAEALHAPPPTAAKPMTNPPLRGGMFTKVGLWGTVLTVVLTAALRYALEARAGTGPQPSPPSAAPRTTAPRTLDPAHEQTPTRPDTARAPAPLDARQAPIDLDTPPAPSARLDTPLAPTRFGGVTTTSSAAAMPGETGRTARPGPIGRAITTASVAPLSAADSLRAELTLLDRARTALRAGEARTSLTALDEYASRFARGSLVPEASALRIDALATTRPAEAKQRARAFLRSYPTHPLAGHVATRLAALGEAREPRER